MHLAKLAFHALCLLALSCCPATAQIFFGHSPVICTAPSPPVEEARILCQHDFGETDYQGKCRVRLLRDDKVELWYLLSVSMYKTVRQYSRNDAPLAFSYDGIECSFGDMPIVGVHNCQSSDDDKTKQCDFCLGDEGEEDECYAAKLAIKKVALPLLPPVSPKVEKKKRKKRKK